MEEVQTNPTRPANPRRKKPTKMQIFKEHYLPVIIVLLTFTLSIVFIAGSITRAVQRNKIAKDAAAGAVLISAIGAVIVGLIILFQPAAFKAMYEYFISNPVMLAVFLLSIIPASLFLFRGVPFGSGGKK